MSELISDEDIDAEVIDAGDIRLASGRALARRIIALTRKRLAERLQAYYGLTILETIRIVSGEGGES